MPPKAIELYEDLVMLPCTSEPLRAGAARAISEAKKLTWKRWQASRFITYDFAFTGRSRMNQALPIRTEPRMWCSPPSTPTYQDLCGTRAGIGIVAMMAYDPKRDTHLRAMDAATCSNPVHPHRHPQEQLPARLYLRIHRDVRASPHPQSGGRRDAWQRLPE